LCDQKYLTLFVCGRVFVTRPPPASGQTRNRADNRPATAAGLV
jgi:hypothetical protein